MLAHIHGADSSKARLAGMLHDIARLYSTKRLLDECELRAMEIDAFERDHPIVLHARLGAQIAQESFAVHDPEILSAIAKHTVGAPEMSTLDCILYLADGLEPGRPFPERAGLWKLALTDLHEAMRATIAQSLQYMERQGLAVAPQTLAAAKAFGLAEGVLPSLN